MQEENQTVVGFCLTISVKLFANCRIPMLGANNLGGKTP
jgi:hypothetical protein